MSHLQEVSPDDKSPIIFKANGSSANVHFSVRTFSLLLRVFRIRKKTFKENKRT